MDPSLLLRTLQMATCLLCSLALAAQMSIDELPHEPSSRGQRGGDWLIDPSGHKAELYRKGKTLVLTNGLIRRAFSVAPNGVTTAFDNLITGESIIRGIKPEAEVSINGRQAAIGGLVGQPNYAYLDPDWIDDLTLDSSSFRFDRFWKSATLKPFSWQRVRHHDASLSWPPPGVHLAMAYQKEQIEVVVHYEMYDGIPVLSKWIEIVNQGSKQILLDSFSSELLAAVEYASTVETREFEIPTPNIHVETDFAFASMIAEDANHHVVHWDTDPEYTSQVSYLRKTPCLLRVSPELGPAQFIQPQDTFRSFRTYVLPHDSYDRERKGLAQRRMYRTIAPWTTENPLMMHARFADWNRVKTAIDQAADVGFEMVILTFGSGFNIEDTSEVFLDEMQRYAAYAKSKGVEIGGYSLLASRSIDPETDVIVKDGDTPTFGHSPCLGSRWAEKYFQTLYAFYKKSGFTLLEHDGSYPGDYCLSTAHPGHRHHSDSRWNQYQTISQFYRWCRGQGIYLNIPDYYFLTGSNKIAMGYREVNWSLPRAQQVIHTRQNIYDGTWTKNVTMGWMFVPLTEYHGGGAAATIEPLHENLDHYGKMMSSNLGAGVQACYRGPRLYDSDATRSMVEEKVRWYKEHRSVLEGDLIHLRRADGRGLDYWLMVKPGNQEKAALVVFNPRANHISDEIRVPLYFSGLTEKTTIYHDDTALGEFILDRQFAVDLPVEVAGDSWSVYFFR